MGGEYPNEGRYSWGIRPSGGRGGGDIPRIFVPRGAVFLGISPPFERVANLLGGEVL